MRASYRPLRSGALRLIAFTLGMSCLCLAAIHPFTLNQMPYSADGLLQLLRGAALEHSLRVDDPLWPRYSSGLVYGYGASLFSFFPPLAYYPTSLAPALGLSFLQAWLLTMCLYTWLAGTGMYLLARLWTRSELGAWVGAAAYVYSPYWLFDSVTRGATAEMAALAALPFVFYGLTRLAINGRRRDFLLAFAALSIFLPLHTVITLHGAAMLALYSLFLVIRAADKRRVFIRLGLAGALGLLLTSFYWLPALAEREAIKLPLIAEQLSHIDVARHLRPLSEVFALPITADPTQQNQAPRISLGWPQLILAAAAVLLSFRRAYPQVRGLMTFNCLIVAVVVFLNTPASAWVWERIPLLGFTQFPWRTLGLAGLALALMAGIGARLLCLSLGEGRRALVCIGGLSLALLVYALPWAYTLFRDGVHVADIRDAQRFEREGGQLALSSYAEYLPVSADASQLDANKMLERFREGDVVPRLLPSPTLEILAQEWRGTAAALHLRSALPQTLEFDWLYLPGWIAIVDGESAPVFPSAGAGLLALDAPAGEFELRVALERTATQSFALALSGLGLAGAITLLWLWRERPIASPAPPQSVGREPPWLLIFAALGFAVFALKSLALDALDTPIKRSRFGDVELAVGAANFDDQIDLLAVDAPSAIVSERDATFRLYWRLRAAPVERDYASIIRMRDPQGLVIAEASSFAPGGLATSNWLPSAYIEDAVSLRIPAFSPPLDEAYTFDVGLYDVETLRPLSLMNAAGDPQAVQFRIAELPLRRSAEPAEAGSRQPLLSADERDLALLLEAPDLPASAAAGDTLQFSWLWQKLRETGKGLSAQVLWLDASGDEAGTADALPLVYGYDFAKWAPGEVNRGHHLLIVPPTLRADTYGLGIRPRDAAGNAVGGIIRLDGSMTVDVPPRVFAAPSFDIELGTAWDNGIILHGFSAETTGDIEFVWGVTRQLKESLRLFAHALDVEGKIAGQWDGVPADWTRPTTGWIAGEYVIARLSLSLPAGQYRLRIGWYAPATGERVGVAAADALEIAPMLVIE